MDNLQFTKIIECFEENIEFLCSPLGIFFAICTLAGIAAAVLLYPKNRVKVYFVYAVVAFFAVVTYYFCELNGSGWKYVILHPGIYFQYSLYGICYIPFWTVFYWVSIGVAAFFDKKKKIAIEKKIILVFLLELFAILFANLCCRIAELSVWMLAVFLDNLRMTYI